MKLTNKQRNTRSRRNRKRIRFESLEQRQLLDGAGTFEILHVGDQEGGAEAVDDAPRFSAVLNALRDEDLGGDGVADNTLTLSSGDAFIPGLFFGASEAVFGAPGVADILIQNELGIEAIALGNHEFDTGTGALANLISGSNILGFDGADFPYLSGNLDFSNDTNLSPLVVADGGAPASSSVTGSVVIDVNGDPVGIVGATTPTLPVISSPGAVDVAPTDFASPPSPAQLDELAAEIQADVDALLAANADMDKVIVLAHMQRIDIELGLAARLTDVDVIVAGGSNTRLFDSNDRPRAGDTVQGEYPIFVDNPDGNPVAVVNTDGNYKYVGRLVIDFDDNGVIIPSSYDPAVSGAYATDAQGVADLGNPTPDPEIVEITNQIRDQIAETDGNFFGVTDVFLNGTRADVRTQETNLGNLTADANLAAARDFDRSVVVSFKNGGGIRDDIGEVVVPPGGTEAVRLPPSGNPISGRPDGGISQNAISNALRFNNELSLLTLTRENLLAVLEHGVSEAEVQAGRFPQVSGVNFSFDITQPPGERIVSAALVDQRGHVRDVLARDGELVGNPNKEVRIVTLNFLAGGGDGYPFPTDASANRVDIAAAEDAPRTGVAEFAADGTEQDALAEYLAAEFPESSPFQLADTDPSLDRRIQNLAFRSDDVLDSVVRRHTVFVTNENDSDVGSFRYAARLASADPSITKIHFHRDVDEVVVSSPVVFSGKQELKIEGANAEIHTSDDFSGDAVFIADGGADLHIRKLTIDGGFETGDDPASAANGILVPIPEDATGVIEVNLSHVKVLNNGLFGLHVDDQPSTDPDAIVGSDASLRVNLYRVVAENNGIGRLDFDGVRVDEGGNGSIYTRVIRSNIDGNGADGLELDERGPGDVNLTVSRSTFNENGFFDIEEDPDDGLDIDETEEGDVIVRIFSSDISNNDDEGLDLDEAGEGHIDLLARDVAANGNFDEGIKLTEEDGGTIKASLSRVDANGNGGDGIQFEEFGEGGIRFFFSRVDAKDNGGEGVQVEELDAGSLFGTLTFSDLSGNGSGGGKFEEDADGNLLVTAIRTTIKDNEGPGIEATQAGDGFGRLLSFRNRFGNNEDGNVELDGVQVLGDTSDS